MRGANVMFQWHGRKDHEFPGGQKLTQKWKIFNKILMKIDNKNFFPNKNINNRLQEIFALLIEETFDHGIERGRIQLVFEELEQKTIIWKNCSQPTPFSFPLITDRIRSKLSSENVEDRIKKMYLQLNKTRQ